MFLLFDFSMRHQEEANLISTACTRAKTEDFLTFLCLRRKKPALAVGNVKRFHLCQQ